MWTPRIRAGIAPNQYFRRKIRDPSEEDLFGTPGFGPESPQNPYFRRRIVVRTLPDPSEEAWGENTNQKIVLRTATRCYASLDAIERVSSLAAEHNDMQYVPRGPGRPKPPKPHPGRKGIPLRAFPGPRGPARPQTCTPTKSGQTAFRYPVYLLLMAH